MLPSKLRYLKCELDRAPSATCVASLQRHHCQIDIVTILTCLRSWDLRHGMMLLH